LAKSVNTPVIASGGVSTLDDLKTLRTLQDDGVIGAIIGRALYEGGLLLKDCLKAVASA
ncbi:MAG: 1-(5-phosphoribosyl)-5-((5-phosphoribosylamino)methylideneamino)imidazole-4-carboxamide isomerase, partial [Nevskia sp.]|nr:1-(5-phosphoribosyl)-5-((5-phosphoribosylamino)methylideneamino)imidazole-4-carboxamide isomerase [Nevskia sp.]